MRHEIFGKRLKVKGEGLRRFANEACCKFFISNLMSHISNLTPKSHI